MSCFSSSDSDDEHFPALDNRRRLSSTIQSKLEALSRKNRRRHSSSSSGSSYSGNSSEDEDDERHASTLPSTRGSLWNTPEESRVLDLCDSSSDDDEPEIIHVENAPIKQNESGASSRQVRGLPSKTLDVTTTPRHGLSPTRASFWQRELLRTHGMSSEKPALKSPRNINNTENELSNPRESFWPTTTAFAPGKAWSSNRRRQLRDATNHTRVNLKNPLNTLRGTNQEGVFYRHRSSEMINSTYKPSAVAYRNDLGGGSGSGAGGFSIQARHEGRRGSVVEIGPPSWIAGAETTTATSAPKGKSRTNARKSAATKSSSKRRWNGKRRGGGGGNFRKKKGGGRRGGVRRNYNNENGADAWGVWGDGVATSTYRRTEVRRQDPDLNHVGGAKISF